MKLLKVEKKGLSQIKSKNRIRIFREILKQQPISRTQLEEVLALSASSVSRVVEQLIADGIVKEAGREQTVVGRKPIMLYIREDAYYTVGVSITKKKLAFCICNLQGQIVAGKQWGMITIHQSDELLMTLTNGMFQLIEEYGIDSSQILTIGVASRGLVNKEQGTILYSLHDRQTIPVISYLQQHFDCPIYLENNVAADLKLQYLYNETLEHGLVYLYMEEGIGGSIICNGDMVDGKNDMAAKFGHLTVEPGGRLCGCGKRGHLEAYVTNSLLIEQYNERKPAAIQSVKELCEADRQGDPDAREILEAALQKLSIAISQLLLVMNPEVFVLYGELFESYQGIIETLKELVGQYLFDEKLVNVDWIIRRKSQVQIEQCIANLALESALVEKV